MKTTPFEMVFIIRDRMRPLKEKVSITIDSDVLERIRLQAEEDDRSLSQFINLVLKEYLKKEKE